MAYQATMKDVAKAAGVSVGTVSNVIKGSRGVSLSMVQRVQAAIRQTGYRAYVSPRANNKTRKTRAVGVVLPSVQDQNFAGIFTGINHILAENGYIASLCVTSEIQAREQRAIEQFVKQRVEGIVIVTCQPESAAMFQSVFDNGTPLVFVEREPADHSFPFVEYANARQLADLVAILTEEGYRRPLLVTGPLVNSSERACADGFLSALGGAAGSLPREQLVLETSFNKESAFSVMVSRLNSAPPPDVIITTSTPLFAGVQRAVGMFEIDPEPAFVTLGSDTWAPANPAHSRVLRRDSMALGEAASRLLINLLNGNDDDRKRRRVIDNAQFNPDAMPKIRKSVRLRARGKHLKALLLAGPACSAVESILPAFQKDSGMKVDIFPKSLPEIGAIIRNPAERAQYDIFQIDQPWLGEAAEDGLLYRLDDWLANRPALLNTWLPGIFDAYCRYQGHYYSLPYLFGPQLLYYRKDLFDDPTLRSVFRKRYHYDLRAPKNWYEFNQIAAFFTKSLNPDSPVEYGVTLGGQNPNAAVCEFMPRLLTFQNGEFGADTMLDALGGREAEAALANYVESYRYAPPGAEDFWWDEQVDLFAQGRASMMILFLGHVAALADRQRSTVIGKIGYDLIPGGVPMLGGWALGVNRDSPARDAALDFIAWTCDPDVVIPLTILGGTPPATRVYHNSELCALYPWLPKAVESFSRSYVRNISKVTTNGKIEERVFEDILGAAVHAAICGRLSPAAALLQAKNELARLMGVS